MSSRIFTKAPKPASATSTRGANNPVHKRRPPLQRQADEAHQENGPSIHGGAAFDFTKIPLFPPNRAGIQAKLRVGAPNGKYEREADQVAGIVMRMPEPGGKEVRREKCKYRRGRSWGRFKGRKIEREGKRNPKRPAKVRKKPWRRGSMKSSIDTGR